MQGHRNSIMKSRGTTVLAIGLIGVLFGTSCRTYETHAIRTKRWPDSQTEALRDVGIGYFQTMGSGKSPLTRQNFYDGLAFSLREIGYITVEQKRVEDVLGKSALPKNRLLSDEEVARLTREFGARLFLQGRIQEVKTEQLLEDSLQVAVSVWIYDAQRGEKIGEIKLFGKDLEFNTARQTLEMSRIVAAKLEELIVNRDSDATYTAN
ncbi:MAG: hypothetical protein RIF32_01430 [Leptospirales bacterium]|jgi:hypothetical protein